MVVNYGRQTYMFRRREIAIQLRSFRYISIIVFIINLPMLHWTEQSSEIGKADAICA
jgi:hypothetical protein